jgi:nitrous oxidase accessory protein NosD
VLPADGYGLELRTTPFEEPDWYLAPHLPPTMTDLPFANSYWVPEAPGPLGPGLYPLDVWAQLHLTEFLTIETVRSIQFLRPPETLIINPQGHQTSNACPTYPDYIVQDMLALDVALAMVQPGEVIGIDGLIEYGYTDGRGRLLLDQDGMTLTCASPGSGIVTGPEYGTGPTAQYPFYVRAPHVTISHLTIDLPQSGTVFYTSNNGGSVWRAAGTQFLENQITCGAGLCVWTSGEAGTLIVGNTFTALGSKGVLHLQGRGAYDDGGNRAFPIDGSRILDNVITGVGPQDLSSATTAGVRVRDGSSVVVSGNDISGGFPHSIYLSNLEGPIIEKNNGIGAAHFGLLVSEGPDFRRTNDLVVKNNKFSDAGAGGVFIDNACRGTFIGNNLNGNPDKNGLLLDLRTGAFAINGNKNVMTDNGSWDCDGDGVADPNILSGGGKAKTGVTFGQLISDALARVKDARDPEKG